MNNKKNEVKAKNKKVRNDWFTKGTDKGCAMRILFFDLLKECLGIKSYNSAIPWNEWTDNRTKPFSNQFKEENRNKSVFTNTALADFILLCIRRDERDKTNSHLKKAVDIIRCSKYTLDLEAYHPEIALQCNGNEIDKCYNRIKEKEGFVYDKCKNCTVAWLFKNLQYIESNYDLIISHKNILLEYPEVIQKSLIEDIYKKIKEYEDLPLNKCCDISILFSLFNSCIKSYTIPDVADEKLAYVKWYTAHLSNWPFFKACLLQANHYDEFSIYQMLRSASDILQVIESNDEELLAAVECDRIVSFLTLGYIVPFSLYYCGNPDDIENNCLKSLQKIKVSNHRYRIYLMLWKLHSHLNKNDLSKYEKEIDTIYNQNSDNAEIAVLNIEYMLYRYHCNLESRDTVKTEIVSLVKKFMNNGIFSESLAIISELFFQYDAKVSPLENFNDNSKLYLALKGRPSFDSHRFIVPDKPSKFHRIFSEYTLSQSSSPLYTVSYYETRRKEIMDHYGLWNSDSE